MAARTLAQALEKGCLLVPGWITTTEAAALAGIKPDTLRHYARTGHSPSPARFGRSLMWHRGDIEDWIASRPGQGARTDLPRR